MDKTTDMLIKLTIEEMSIEEQLVVLTYFNKSTIILYALEQLDMIPASKAYEYVLDHPPERI